MFTQDASTTPPPSFPSRAATSSTCWKLMETSLSQQNLECDTTLERYRDVNYVRFASLENEGFTLPPLECFADILRDYEKGALSQSRAHDFTTYICMMINGIYRMDEILELLVREDALGIYGFNNLLKRVFFNYAIIDAEWLGEKLDTVFDFCSLLARFPVIPPELLDSVFCTMCLYETDHSLEAAEKRFAGIMCSHFLEAHEAYHAVPELDISNGAATAVTEVEMQLDDYHQAITEGGDVRTLALRRDGGHVSKKDARITNFLKVMGRVRDECIMGKLEQTMVDYRRNLTQARLTHHRLRARKNLSISAVEIVNLLVRCERRRVEVKRRLRELSGVPGGAPGTFPPVDTPRIWLELKLSNATDKNLITPIATAFYAAAVPPMYKYSHKYNLYAHRVIFFKHMESVGFTNDNVATFQERLKLVELKKIVGRDFTPSSFPIKTNAENFGLLMRLYWVIANLVTFQALHNKAVPLFHGDSPKLDLENLPDGLYLFNDAVGFKHTAVEPRGFTAPWDDILDFLHACDHLLSLRGVE
uniref:Non-structural core protein n=1 Tax=Latid herpesvirus 1 TaxID=3096545 RepID=A0AB33V6I5_9VIRU